MKYSNQLFSKSRVFAILALFGTSVLTNGQQVPGLDKTKSKDIKVKRPPLSLHETPAGTNPPADSYYADSYYADSYYADSYYADSYYADSYEGGNYGEDEEEEEEEENEA